MNKTIRQGDILLRQVDRIKGKKIGTGRRILAYGEKTGHNHTMIGDVNYYDNGNGSVLCQVFGQAELTHQEHHNIQIPKGDYIVIRQREFDLVEGIRRVQD